VAKRKASPLAAEDLLEDSGEMSDSSSSDSGLASLSQAREGGGQGRSKRPRKVTNRRRGRLREGDEEEIHSCILVLDCIVERKTVNDLASSIVDGRYEEQKGRLKGCGIFNCVYLVEGASLNPQGVRGRGKPTGEQESRAGATINTNAIITALAATQVWFTPRLVDLS
jgi:hypothetical protein